MNERIARKDLRRDEFMETLEKGVEYTQSHVRTMVMAGTAVVAVALAAWGVYAWRASVRYSANDALAGAMRVWGAGIDVASPKPLDVDAPTFVSEDARRKRAQELFEALVKEHAGSTAADVGKLYLASIAIQQGQTDHARELWQAYVKDHPRDMLAASLQLDLVRLDRSQGKTDAVVTELKRLIADPDHAAPLDTLLYELAKTLEQQGKADEARQAWQRIADEFPRSPYFAEAQKSSTAANLARNL